MHKKPRPDWDQSYNLQQESSSSNNVKRNEGSEVRKLSLALDSIGVARKRLSVQNGIPTTPIQL